MSTPLVTVALPVRNAEATVEMAIGSILWQTLPNWELLIVDDGSTDRTIEIASRFQDDRVKIIRQPVGHIGLAARLNQCISLARGTYVARMDGDDISYPWRLERQVEFLEKNPDIDVLGTGAIVFRGNGEVLGRYPSPTTHEEICGRPWWGFPFAHPTWMGKRSWFQSHPYSDRHVRCEDQALLFQTRLESRFSCLDEIVLGYRFERVSAIKLGRGRLNYCRMLLSQVRDGPSGWMATRGVTTHLAAFLRDLLLQYTRPRCSLRTSFGSIDESALHEWQTVWSRLASSGQSAVYLVPPTSMVSS